ncbi:monooxygenase [Trapelia coarctata]|nr:monooxygenase [Trapelia coarctata]
MGDTHELDVVVIGAGISGISAAKFYLDIHPNCRLVVLDKDQHVGGTWNSRRSYDRFWTQWTVGTAEFSDIPMPRPPEEDLYHEFFKAKYTTEYLENYVDQQNYAGRTLRDRIRFGIEVQSIRKIDGAWVVSTKEEASGNPQTFHCSKLMVASGLTSVPYMPVLPGREKFGGLIIHQEAFGSSNILSSPHIQKITVLGGGKSSADMIYAAVKAGKSVTWVIKATDTTGPAFFLSPKGKGPYKNVFEICMTRLAATFTPSFLNGETWWTRFLHGSSYGVKLVRSFWDAVDKQTRKDADYEGRPNLHGFEKLSPHSPIFWQNGIGGLLNHDEFFDLIAQNVRIYSADILSLGPNLVHLQTGEKIPSDALLCGTGWVPSLQFLSPPLCIELGLPYPRASTPHSEQALWTQLEAAADERVLASFRQLAHPPPYYQRPVTHTPYRLYKHITPLCDAEARSIVFIGHIHVGSYFRAVESQAIWATAYLDGKLALPSEEKRREEVALFTAWCRRRYLSNGQGGNWMTFELVGYTDSLLKEVGLRSHRKGWWRDLFEPCTAKDLRGLREEYVRLYGEDGEGKRD